MYCNSFRPVKQQDPRPDEWHQLCQRHDILRNIKFSKSQKSLKELFRAFDKVSPDIYEAVKREGYWKKIKGLLNEQNYCEKLKVRLSVDEAHTAISWHKFDILKLEPILESVSHDQRYKRFKSSMIKLYGLSGVQRNFIKYDGVLLKKSETDAHLVTRILEIQDDHVILRPTGDSLTLPESYPEVVFLSQGLTYGHCERALEQAKQDTFLRRIIFGSNNKTESMLSPVKIPLDPLPASKRLRKLNVQQIEAMTGILAAECRPSPYILFAPPGTGKTRTLVEAIVQICARDGKAKVLYCAKTKECAEQTMDRLEKVDLLKGVDMKYLKTYDGTDDVGSIRILVTTIMKSGSLMGDFKYDYVFVDEACQAHEPETLIPICCLKEDGCLVLAGDPKQLGPPLKWAKANQGLKISMLERLLQFKVYQKDRATSEYDNRYITKLSYCYGYDPRLVAISNELFYGELECIHEIANPILAKLKLSGPIQFCDVRENESQPDSSNLSLYKADADCCAKKIMDLYAMGIERDQLGVVAPYKFQAKLITDKLTQLIERWLTERSKAEDKSTGGQANFHETVDRWICKIDIVNTFQHMKRDIIIISTVRLNKASEQLDFSGDPQRINVALSRAKWLLYIVGNKEAYVNNNYWERFMNYVPNTPSNPV